jgi:hypothetical protein
MSGDGLELLAEALEGSEALAEDAVEDGLKNMAEDEAENIAKNIGTKESAEDYAGQMVEKGAKDSLSIGRTAGEGANREVADAVEQGVVDGAEKNGLATSTAEAAEKPMTQEAEQGVRDLADKTLSSPEETAKLKGDIANPPSKATKAWEWAKNNKGSILVGGVTVTVVVVWLATGHGIQDLIHAIANVLDDLGKNLIGALAGIGKFVLFLFFCFVFLFSFFVLSSYLLTLFVCACACVYPKFF